MGTALPKVSADYAAGFANAILINGAPLVMSHPGETFWVDENASRTGRGSYKAPDTTIQTAIDRCVAGRGDIIFVKPGHTESNTTTTAVVMDTASVALIGLGRGDDQALITYTADTGYMNITAENCLVSGFYFPAGVADQAIGINVAIGGDYFTFAGNRVYSPSALLEYVIFMNIVAGANFITIADNDIRAFVGSGGASAVKTIGESIGITCLRNVVIGPYSESCFDMNATAITGYPLFSDNSLMNHTAAADYCVEIDASTVATFVREQYGNGGEPANAPVTDLSASFCIDCHGVELPNVSSLRFPKTATAWA
jgi:hypothetical protein